MHNIPLEKIEQYLHGEMSGQERLLFESELATDEELASAFNLYRKIEQEMRTGKDDAGKAAVKDSLQLLGNTYFKKKEAGKAKTFVSMFYIRRNSGESDS